MTRSVGVSNKVLLWLVTLVMAVLALCEYVVDWKFAHYGMSTEAIVTAKHAEQHWFQKGPSYYLTLNYATDEGAPYTQDYRTLDATLWSGVHPGDRIGIFYLKGDPTSIQPRDEHILCEMFIAWAFLMGVYAFWMFVWP